MKILIQIRTDICLYREIQIHLQIESQRYNCDEMTACKTSQGSDFTEQSSIIQLRSFLLQGQDDGHLYDDNQIMIIMIIMMIMDII